jgi:glycosyltransferase involved in cell wall biosynthesis
MRVLSLAHTIWTDRWLNRQQLLSRIGTQATVLYSNAAWYTWSHRDPSWQAGLWLGDFQQHDSVNVESVPKWLMRSPRFPRLDHAVIGLQVRRWRSWLDRHGDGPLVLHLFHPDFAIYVDHIQYDTLIYHPYDLFEHMPGWLPHQQRAEGELLQRADQVIVSSEPTGRRLSERGARRVDVIPNGVDLRLFDDAIRVAPPPPEDLSRIPSPRIGFIGSLQPSIDFQLVAALAERRPQWQFVFVGGRSPRLDDEYTRIGVARCEAMSNVHFLGIKHRDAVPAYMLNMDVNTMFWRVGHGMWAELSYPLKLQEYLACGLPIVTADIQAVKPFDDQLAIASGVEGWELAIRDALEGRSPGTTEGRRSIAARNGWDARAEQLVAVMRRLVER